MWLGPENLELGHLGRCPYPGVGRQWCQSQLSDASLRPPAQIRGAPNISSWTIPSTPSGTVFH